jgi:hypothetical protein
MNEENTGSIKRVLTLPSESSAEIRLERAGDKVQVYSSFKSPQSSGNGTFWWHRCTERGCLGEAVAPGHPCIRHLDRSSRAAYLASVSAPHRLSLRGVEVSQILWEEIRRSPAFAEGAPRAPIDFAGAEINTGIRLEEVEFKHSVNFFGASIYGIIELRKCRFRQGLDARYARLKAPINFWQSTFDAEVNISYLESDQNVGFDGVTFNGSLTGDGAAATIHLTSAIVSGNASFKHSRSWLLLNGATLNGLFDLTDADLIALHGEQLALTAASRFGPCSIKHLYLARATLGARIHMDVTADTVDLSDAILKEGGSIVLDRAAVNLRQVSLGGPLRMSGKLPGTAMPAIIGLLNADAGKMSFARVDMSRCSLYGAHGLGTMDIESTVGFARCPWWASRRHYLADEWAWRAAKPSKWHRFRWKLTGVRIGNEQEKPKRGEESANWLPTLRASQIAGTYRDLRRSLEGKSDMPGASDFYYGEMEMRRRDNDSSFWDRVLVTLYWLLSGYGLRTTRSVIAYIILISLGTWGMQFGGFEHGCYSISRAALFSLRASLPGISTVEQLSRSGQTVEIVVRVFGALILALLVLSLRTRVMRKPGE